MHGRKKHQVKNVVTEYIQVTRYLKFKVEPA
jgi:hypothetical protein